LARNKIKADESSLLVKQDEIRRLLIKKFEQKEVFKKLEEVSIQRERESEKVALILDQMEEFIGEERAETAEIEGELELQRRKLDEVERILHSVEVQMHKLQ
jgi:ribosomal protein S3